jgi:hypothetical protein
VPGKFELRPLPFPAKDRSVATHVTFEQYPLERDSLTRTKLADRSLLKEGKNGQAGRLATNSYAFDNILSHGAYQQQVIHSRPGFWVLACFMDTQDHREHTVLGMERVIQIVK